MKILQGDCSTVIRTIADDSIDSVVTDPPYALVSIVKRFGAPNAAPAISNGATGVYTRASSGFMGKTWDTGETAFSVEFWSEVMRVLKPGGHVIAFGGTRTYHRLACAIEDAGFEIRDLLSWLYGTGFPKSHNVALSIDKEAGAVGHLAKSFNMKGGDRSNELADNGRDFSIRHESVTPEAIEWDGWGTALKPALEPIAFARKPLSEKTVAANVLRWRTGAININGCRIDAPDGVPKFNKRNEVSVGVLGDGLNGSNRTGVMDTSTGRWPANVMHDGSDEVVGMFPQSAGQQGVVDGQTSGRSVYNNGVGPRPRAEPRNDSGSAARFFYSAKASKTERNGSKHPTVKPIALMQWLCRLVTPPGGVVLDPFAGSGTTGEAAHREGFDCILIEREAEYIADINRRFCVPAFPWAPPKIPWET